MQRCEITDTLGLNLCDEMQQALREKNNHPAYRWHGLVFGVQNDMLTNGYPQNYITLKSGAKRRGMLLNFCPFCGADIATHKKGHP